MTATHRASASLDEWTEFVRTHPQLSALDAFVIDVNGNTVGKRLAIEDAHKVFTDGVQYSSCALIADVRGLGHNVQGMGGSDGDPDGTALPIAGTLRAVPWARAPTAQVLCSMRHVEQHGLLWFDPREVLQALLDRCQRAHIHPVVACELEFYLVDPRRTADGGIALATLPGRGSPPRRAANLSMDAVEAAADFLNRVSAAAAEQGVPACGAVAEYGIGQYEINLRHVADPLLAADHAVLLKRIISGVAQSMGMLATFMAKPFAHQAGSGLHVHVSINDESGANRFGGARRGGVVAGSNCRHAGLDVRLARPSVPPASIHIVAISARSCRRRSDWGHNNRAVAFRVPAALGSGRRVEHRVAGADASPHLVVAAVLAALLHGVTHHLKPTAPTAGRVRRAAAAAAPDNLLAALERLEHSSLLAQYMPAKFLQLFAELKRKEYAALIDELFSREYDFYL